MSTSKIHPREPLTTRQRNILMNFYNQNPYPTASERQQLVELTGRTSKQIQDWFSNRRRTDSRLVTPKSSTVATSAPAMVQPVYYYLPCNCPYCFHQTYPM